MLLVCMVVAPPVMLLEIRLPSAVSMPLMAALMRLMVNTPSATMFMALIQTIAVQQATTPLPLLADKPLQAAFMAATPL